MTGRYVKGWSWCAMCRTVHPLYGGLAEDPTAHRVIGRVNPNRSPSGEVEMLLEHYGLKPEPWVSPNMPGRESEPEAHSPDDGGRGAYYELEPAVKARAWIAARA